MRSRSPKAFPVKPIACAIHLVIAAVPVAAQTAAADEPVRSLSEVRVTAEQEIKQAPGVSTITTEDIQKRPPVNDIADIVRTMPGVNLTGNSSSGQYGNNRQIDLRGMGPENTLILIDGKPVHSRDSVRMGRSGERNTRGDSNWVPAEAIERIEVLRGPAAARYGSGAAGGVVNIITKKPTREFQGSVSLYASKPQHDEEGDTRRLGFNLSGPIGEQLSFRLYGNVNKTDADAPGINAGAVAQDPDVILPPAGREGVRNRDINGLLRWDLAPGQALEFEAGFSRQGNIYAGDRAVSSTGSELLADLAGAGAETNTMYRRTTSVTHRGDWGGGISSRVGLSYERTDNKRLNEGLAGATEGSIGTATERSVSTLDNYLFSGEVNLPLKLGGVDQVLTAGLEARRQKLDDPYSMSQSMTGGGTVSGAQSGTRDGRAKADAYALFVEDNIYLMQDALILTPGLRFDHHDKFGSNWSPSLNASYKLSEELTLKGGIARAFKAPNLYQSNPNYLYYTMGNGCPLNFPSQGAGCYVQGNADLEAETSVNKEIGLAWTRDAWAAGLTYFHNDYKNKIVAGMEPTGLTDRRGLIFQWTNAPKAIVQGIEGHLTVPLGESVLWHNNLTFMIENKNKETGQPLSIIPRYTVNSSLDWKVDERLSVLFTGTFYGKQKPPTQTMRGAEATGLALNQRGSYAVFGISAGYQITPKTRLGAGISNLFDKRLFRESVGVSAGAATYNEPGRSFYVSLNHQF